MRIPRPRPRRIARLYCSILLVIVGRAIQGLWAVDPEIREEIALFPADTICTLTIRPNGPSMHLRRVDQAGFTLIRRSPPQTGLTPGPELKLIIKDLTSALMILTFRESTSVAAAHDRIIIEGSIPLGCSFVRILERTETYLLPAFIARRAMIRYARPDRITTRRLRLCLETVLRQGNKR